MKPLRMESARRNQRFTSLQPLAFLACAAILAASNGCSHSIARPKWASAEPYYAARINTADDPFVDVAAAAALAENAAKWEAVGDAHCVDLYFAAVCRQWKHVAGLGEFPTRDDILFESRSYNAYLAKLLSTAQRFGRLDATTGLHVVCDNQPLTVPVVLHGFAWKAEDFNHWELVGDNRLNGYSRSVRNDGVGVPLVVKRCRKEPERFYRHVQPFAATAVLRTPRFRPIAAATDWAHGTAGGDAVLEFYDPAHCTQLAGENERWVVAGDLTAPLAWTAHMSPNSPIQGFLRPDRPDDQAQLVMLEPYQCGKIPLVLVHGLASDPTMWLTQLNALRANDWFRERYQAWAFRYPTGRPFLQSAATLRRELQAAVALSPGAADDPAAEQMVLIGHSMGGLLSKLQVTESGTAIWDIVADRPLDAINADDADRERLRETFFFAPLPFVSKVVYIGTPHNGASLASRGVGRVSSLAVDFGATADERHRRLVRDNPGVFSPWIARKVPTSVDLLRPDHPLLEAMKCLAVAPEVQQHSIIGVADYKKLHGPGDGVVPLKSASQKNVASVKFVAETHEGLHEAATTSVELERILKLHAQGL